MKPGAARVDSYGDPVPRNVRWRIGTERLAWHGLALAPHVGSSSRSPSPRARKPLVDWTLSGAPVNGTTTCGLTGLEGNWIWNNYDGQHPEPFGANDGYFLHDWMNGSFLPTYHASVSNGRLADATCRM